MIKKLNKLYLLAGSYGEDTNAKGTRMTRIKRIFISVKQKNP